MTRARGLCGLLLGVALAAPGGARAQAITVVDSVIVTTSRRLARVQVVGPSTGFVADTLRFTFRATDPTGAPVPALISAALTNPQLGLVVMTSDTTASVVVAAAGRLVLRVTARSIDGIVIGFQFPDGRWRWDNPELRIGERVQACAFLLSGADMIPSGQPGCPQNPPTLQQAMLWALRRRLKIG